MEYNKNKKNLKGMNEKKAFLIKSYIYAFNKYNNNKKINTVIFNTLLAYCLINIIQNIKIKKYNSINLTKDKNKKFLSLKPQKNKKNIKRVDKFNKNLIKDPKRTWFTIEAKKNKTDKFNQNQYNKKINKDQNISWFKVIPNK